jgi:2',3'-cyclic-nucleotide 2'-phosphodiesterase (5'-nucleotidase family)
VGLFSPVTKPLNFAAPFHQRANKMSQKKAKIIYPFFKNIINLSTMERYVITFLLMTALLLAEEAKPTLRILFTNSANGQVENCHCPDHPYGGLEKRALYLEKYHAQFPNALILDNGDNFTFSMLKDPEAITVQAFELMPYDLINLGDQDIAAAPEAYLSLEKIVRRPNQIITLQKENIHVSILAYLHPATTNFYPEFTFENMEILSPQDIIPQWLQQSKSADLQILLSHSGFENDEEIARAFPEIDLIVGGHSQTVLDSLYLENGVPIVQAGGNAYYIGEIILEKQQTWQVKSHSLIPLTLEMPDHPELKKQIDQWHQKQQQLRELRKKNKDSK